MMGLLGRIAVFLIAAFGLGLVVGFLAWGYGRHAVPASQWRARERERLALGERAADAERRTVAAEQDAEIQRRELARLRELLARTWAERDDLAGRLTWVEHETAALRLERDRAVERTELLQRRLAELSIARARTHGIPPAMAPNGPGSALGAGTSGVAGASGAGGTAGGVVIDLRADALAVRSRVAPPTPPRSTSDEPDRGHGAVGHVAVGLDVAPGEAVG